MLKIMLCDIMLGVEVFVWYLRNKVFVNVLFSFFIIENGLMLLDIKFVLGWSFLIIRLFIFEWLLLISILVYLLLNVLVI